MKRSISLRRFTALLLGLLILTGSIFSFGAPEKVSAAAADFTVTLGGSQLWMRPYWTDYLSGSESFVTVEANTDNYHYYYAVTPIICDTTGQYSVICNDEGTDDIDAMFYIYSGSFDPASPVDNFLIGNDDYTGLLPGIPEADLTLTAGNVYLIVTTSYNAIDEGLSEGGDIDLSEGAGAVAFTVSGPGSVTVPYSLTYAAGTGGSLTGSTTQYVLPGGTGTAVTAAADPDYVFTGWSDGITSNSRTDAAVASDLSFTAEFAQLFDVTFDSQGGSSAAGITAADGSLITAPAAPVMAGYAFGGWYKEAACTNAWDFAADTITADTTLFAKWTIAYTVTFDSQGGSSVTGIAAADGSLIAAPAAPTREGYTFGGWYKEAA